MIKKKDNRIYTINTTIWFGKHKGKKIEEVLKEEPTYVTKYMAKDLGMNIVGTNKVKKASDRTYGYDTGKGLFLNYCFTKNYVISKAKGLEGVRIACKETGLIVNGKTLEECEEILNKELDGLWYGLSYDFK